MSLVTRVRGMRMRTAGLVVAGATLAGLAAFAGPALAGSSSSAMSMAGMTAVATSPNTTGPNRKGTTKGWYDGKTVTFTYTRGFLCSNPNTSKALTHCEAGTEYDGTPAASFDPLYVVVPIGFTPAKSTLQCPTAGKCVDHPSSIDLSAVFGSSSYDNVLLPPHSHVIQTLNGGSPEWWNVVVVGVSAQSEWNKIVKAKNYSEIQLLRESGDKHVTSNVPTNLFLYFSAS